MQRFFVVNLTGSRNILTVWPAALHVCGDYFLESVRLISRFTGCRTESNAGMNLLLFVSGSVTHTICGGCLCVSVRACGRQRKRSPHTSPPPCPEEIKVACHRIMHCFLPAFNSHQA